ncbi:hypothetical protein ON010_g3985 [Phytophthora cinnamomi]|nr:hypothetical protein ON010_g3985 [Phytophthora cinnamomi]
MGEGRMKTSSSMSDLQKCSWGVSSGVQLHSRRPQQPQQVERVASRSTINLGQTLRPFEQTLRPFEQTVNPFEETIRPFAQTIKPSSNHTRHSQQLSREPRQHPRPSQQHASRPARRNNQSQQALRHSVATLRPPRSSSEVSRPSERPSQHLSNHRVSSFQHSMGPSRPVSNHRVSHQPLPGTPMTLSDLVTEESTDSNDNSIPLTMELTPRRQREVIARMKKSVKKAIDSMLPDSTKNSQWKLKLRKKDISCYVDETTVKPGQTRFCCVSHTHATVDEVMSLFLSTDKETQLRNNRLLYDNMLENRVLTELREPTKERPMNSMNVRYSTYQTPGPLANRQMCLVMATDMVRQPDGSMIGYCLWDSIEDPEFAKAKKPGLEVCTMFRSGFFVRRSGRRESSDKLTQGQTKIVYMVGMEHAAWASGLTARFLMEKYGNTLGRICSHLRRKNFDSQTFVMKTQWASKISAKSCKQCEKPFQVLSNRVNCHACGQVVCRSCTSKESVEIHGVGIVPTHICFWCLEKAGLPAPAPTSAQKHRKSMRIKRLESDTAVMYRASCQANAMAQQREHSVSVVNADLSDDDEDRESGEWAITTQGIPRWYPTATPASPFERCLDEARVVLGWDAAKVCFELVRCVGHWRCTNTQCTTVHVNFTEVLNPCTKVSATVTVPPQRTRTTYCKDSADSRVIGTEYRTVEYPFGRCYQRRADRRPAACNPPRALGAIRTPESDKEAGLLLLVERQSIDHVLIKRNCHRAFKNSWASNAASIGTGRTIELVPRGAKLTAPLGAGDQP